MRVRRFSIIVQYKNNNSRSRSPHHDTKTNVCLFIHVYLFPETFVDYESSYNKMLSTQIYAYI